MLIAIVLGVMLAACSGRPTPIPPPPPSTMPALPASAPTATVAPPLPIPTATAAPALDPGRWLAALPGNIAQGQPAPDFTVRTMGGGEFALADHAGQPTLILFMASWCTSCVYEAQNLAQVYTRYKDRGLSVIALDCKTATPTPNCKSSASGRATPTMSGPSTTAMP